MSMQGITTISIEPKRDLTPSAAPITEARKVTVLIVDDAKTNRHLVSELISRSNLDANTLLAEDGLQAFQMMRQTPVDLVVCDLNMPRCDGLKFLQLKRTDASLDNIPVIVLSGADDNDRKVQALTSGASDYVTKPCDLAELSARISIQLKLHKLQSELVRANGELGRLTLTDSLTGVSNRRHFTQCLEEEFIRARRYDRPLSLALLDIDHFKRVNDTFGHQAGDEVLVAVAALCKRTLRCHDVVARYGGEEFALILPETSIDGAVLAIDRLRELIAREVVRTGNLSIAVTASFGIASFPHELVSKAGNLVTLADAALYDAKRSGRNRVVTAR